MSEGTLLKKVMIAASSLNYRLFRNNVAKSWVGTDKEFIKSRKSIIVNPGDVVIRKARPLNAGLCKGSSDLIGWKSVTITEDMIGNSLAVFVAFECKTGRLKTTKEQDLFLKAVNSFGGIGRVVRDERDIGE